MDIETQIIVVGSVLGSVSLVMLVIMMVLCCQVSSLKKKVSDMQSNPRMRVQKLKLDDDKNHAFHNPALSPEEELAKRGYSMYMGQDSRSDVESGRFQNRQQDRQQERQTGGHFVDELIQELDNRQQRQQTTAPPFLLQSIQDNKMKTRNTMNPIANGNGRQSDTNPNFIY